MVRASQAAQQLATPKNESSWKTMTMGRDTQTLVRVIHVHQLKLSTIALIDVILHCMHLIYMKKTNCGVLSRNARVAGAITKRQTDY